MGNKTKKFPYSNGSYILLVVLICISTSLLMKFPLIGLSGGRSGITEPYQESSLVIISQKKALSLEYIPRESISVSNDEELAAVATYGTGSEIAPFVIEGWNITTQTGWNTDTGIFIYNTTVHFIIQNCWIGHSPNGWLDWGISLFSVGIYIYSVAPGTVTIRDNICLNQYNHSICLWNVDSATVVNNLCTNNDDIGIFLENCKATTIINNTCSHNLYGICISNSNSTVLSNNTCRVNYIGIYLFNSDSVAFYNNSCTQNIQGISLVNSENTILFDNTCSQNFLGFHLFNFGNTILMENTCTHNVEEGIKLYSSKNITLTNNTFAENNGVGVNLIASDECLIIWNMLAENKGVGVYLSSGCETNQIHHNIFLNNKNGGTQACDKGTSNFWFDKSSLKGNEWSDHTGIGEYLIDGSAGNSDPYPIADFDMDGMPNWWERQIGTNPFTNDAEVDLDQDNLT
ncbi:MAG: nitrous oxide reductase family maturation protein NosD, partial [Candidatus Hodarchaeota archaeon]